MTAIRIVIVALALASAPFDFSQAAAPSCASVFKSPLSSLDKAVYRPQDPQAFGEINSAYNEWTVENSRFDRSASVSVDRERNEVRMTGVASAMGRSTFVMNLEQPFESTRGSEDQDIGAGLVMHLQSSSETPVVVELRGHTRESLKGGRQPVVAEAILQPSELNRRVAIPWSRFKVKNSYVTERSRGLKIGSRNDGANYPGAKSLGFGIREYRYQFAAGTDFMPSLLSVTSIAFAPQASRLQLRKSNVRLTLKGSIYRDFNLDYLADKQPSGSFNESIFVIRSLNIHHTAADLTAKLQSKEAQDYAFEMIRQGHDAVASELAKYGFEMIEISGKITEKEFFDLFDERKWQRGLTIVPIEAGAFANYHGRYTHAAQMLTLLYKATPEKIEGLRRLNEFFSDPVWHNVWNVLFDAPGSEGPNTPLWWVAEFKRRQITSEPAAR